MNSSLSALLAVTPTLRWQKDIAGTVKWSSPYVVEVDQFYSEVHLNSSTHAFHEKFY